MRLSQRGACQAENCAFKAYTALFGATDLGFPQYPVPYSAQTSRNSRSQLPPISLATSSAVYPLSLRAEARQTPRCKPSPSVKATHAVITLPLTDAR